MFSQYNQTKISIMKIFAIIILLITQVLFSQEIDWQREYQAVVDGDTLFFAYSGGFSHFKPAFVDIDGDADFDLFVGEYYGNIIFHRNDGTQNTPSWVYVTQSYHSRDFGWAAEPIFVDIDADSDFDMFIGESDGCIYYYRNDGTAYSASWTLISEQYDSIDVDARSSPVFADIDADSDFDMFIGVIDGSINFYRNDGTADSASWTLVSENYDSIDVGIFAKPTFVDIDGDSDFDMFIGENDGNINFYRNDGTADSASWNLVTENYDSITVGSQSAPTFVDIDADSDFDMFIGDAAGNINFYLNIGTQNSPSWTFITENFITIDVGGGSDPAFIDIDADSDFDMFIGEGKGNINFYRNDGTENFPSWTFVTEEYDSIDVGEIPASAFVDIDGDSDFDMFIGENDGNINFYRNDGTADSVSWNLVTENYESIDVGSHASPAFVDIDADSDFDMFIGKGDGNINFYRNDGTADSASWTLVSESYDSINVGSDVKPRFVDIDGDFDFDMFIGEWYGFVNYYRNDGTPDSASWTLVEDNYKSVEFSSAPAFVDIDGDGDFDMFIGQDEGGLSFWRNMGLSGVEEDFSDEDIVCHVEAKPAVFNSSVIIEYYLSTKQRISLGLYDVSGRHVITLVDGEIKSGNNYVRWDGKSSFGKPVATGIYFCVLESNGIRKGVKLIIIK